MTVKDPDRVRRSTMTRTPRAKGLAESNTDNLPKIPRTRLILEGEDKDVFSVQPESLVSGINVQLQVKQPQNLDYEVKQQMILKVRKTMCKSQFVILEAPWVDFCDPLVV